MWSTGPGPEILVHNFFLAVQSPFSPLGVETLCTQFSFGTVGSKIVRSARGQDPPAVCTKAETLHSNSTIFSCWLARAPPGRLKSVVDTIQGFIAELVYIYSQQQYLSRTHLSDHCLAASGSCAISPCTTLKSTKRRSIGLLVPELSTLKTEF